MSKLTCPGCGAEVVMTAASPTTRATFAGLARHNRKPSVCYALTLRGVCACGLTLLADLRASKTTGPVPSSVGREPETETRAYEVLT